MDNTGPDRRQREPAVSEPKPSAWRVLVPPDYIEMWTSEERAREQYEDQRRFDPDVRIEALYAPADALRYAAERLEETASRISKSVAAKSLHVAFTSDARCCSEAAERLRCLADAEEQ